MKESLAPARGILIALTICAVFWLLVAALILHQSVMSELGRRAVEQGVFR
jgi:hypothetical protein